MIKTILAATFILALCGAALGIGYLITGKSKLRKSCGNPPDEDENSSGGSCGSGRCGGCSR